MFLSTILVSNAYAADTEKFRFKIGFEFQEDHHLCNWAKERQDVQKIPIFTVENADKEKLWHLEIDGEDIEFVTPPFSSEEQESKNLQKSLQSIDISYKKLYSMKGWKKEKFPLSPDLTINEWVYGVDTTNMSLRKQLEAVYKSNPKKSVEEKLEEIKKSAQGLKSSLDIQLVTQPLFNKIKDIKFNNLYCNISFTPQVTIQHFLKDTIPLLFTLTDKKTFPKFRAALPFYSDKTKFLGQNYFSSENGLLFLHALTITGIKHYKSFQHNDIIQSLNNVKENFEKYRQVDAKIYLDFLSRRPFSEMWQDIKDSISEKSFNDLYHERIINSNDHFKEAIHDFRFFNYAEEYYTNELKRYNFLNEYLSKFTHISEEENNTKDNTSLLFLLENGILSTGMIQMLHTEIFEDYLTNSINSVESAYKRPMFDHKSFEIHWADSTVDSLSPPWFLHPENSMGFYSIAHDKAIGDTKDYGEAVLEMRSISRINPRLIEKIKGSRSNYGEFLTARESGLYDDANMLYFYLKNDFNESIFESIKTDMKNL
jgi:hypothetical protein